MSRRRHLGLPLVLVGAVLATACGDAATGPGPADTLDLTQPWQSAEPVSLGADAAKLDAAAAQAAAVPRFRSLLVVRDGRLVLERYFGGAGPDDLADIRSGTKSVVSTLVGIALEDGYLSSLDQTLLQLLPASVAVLRPDEEGITIRDLLTMTGGWDWDESTVAGYNDWVTSSDHVQYLLNRPLADPPGTVFTYNSAAVHLLGVILEQATGMSLPTFADQALFAPIGISSRAWEPFPEGTVNGGSGLDLRPRDLARIGQLFLQDGVSGDRRVVAVDWIAEATRAHFPWTSDGGSTHLSYGYLWWTDADNDAYFAWGYRGQYIYVAPARRLVVVATTAWWAIDGQSAPSDLDRQALAVIVNGVLPAVPVE
jgi:CubicO group peptidase (beta-lactamase class C family)